MKKNFLFAFAALIAVSSCTSEINEEGFVDKANSISFNAYSNKSRAVTDDVTSENMKGDMFGVVGYYTNKLYLYTNTNKAVAQKWDVNSWEYDKIGELKFWPNGTMDFYAYFPHSDDATFATTNNSSEAVMTISTTCAHDVLFAYAGNQSKQTRVPLNFYHAFAKIKGLVIEMPTEGNLFKSNCQVKVQNVEFINTSTSGDIKVDNGGVASYSVTSPNATLKRNLTGSGVTINNSSTTGTLINNDDKAKDYLFATNSSTTPTNFVKGTGKTMWNGIKASIGGEGAKLSTSELVCLKLTCKVWNGANDNKYYYVGDDDNYGEIYIPLTKTDATPNDVTTFDAGKRYTYTIKMKDNVGFDDNGDPILTPILFYVESVADWTDVNVTITL